MDIGVMAALGMFDSDNEVESDNAKGGKSLTDYQFKSFIKMSLTLAETTREVKEFNKRIGAYTLWGSYGPFTQMISKIAEATGDMEKVKQVLQDILKMEGEIRR